jgi:hypothetical protein
MHLGWDPAEPSLEALPSRLSLVSLGATASSPLQHQCVALYKCNALFKHANTFFLDCLEIILMMW